MNFCGLKYLFFTGIFLLGCRPLARKYLGVKKSKILSDKQIVKWSEKFEIDKTDLYKLDIEAYGKAVKSVNDSFVEKDLYQPLQVKSFSSTGVKQAHLINCIMQGFPEIDWNTWCSLDSFPMAQNKAPKIKSPFSFEQELSFLIPLDKSEVSMSKIYNQEEIIIVYWSRSMNKRSEELINEIKEYVKWYSDHDISVLYVNNDNYYDDLWSFK